jgi:hypothetical protein
MNLYTRTDNNPDLEVLTREYIWRGIIVPIGFAFDGASAPRIFWFIIPPFKRTKKAACIHDWLCRGAKNMKERKVADEAFYKALREVRIIDKKTGREKSGIARWRCQLGYLGVRVGAYMGIGVYY